MILKIYNALFKEYGPQGWWPVNGRYFPEHENKFEIIVGSILTQNTSWTNVEKALRNLRKENLIDPEKILKVETNKLAELIKPSGYYNQKAKRLKEVTKNILPHLKNNTVPTRKELLKIKGIGPETADSILLYAFHVPIFVIDAYTRRLLIRIGICKAPCDYNEAQKIFMKSLPRNEKIFNEYHALIVKHGKDICKKTPICNQCILKKEGLCRYEV